MIAALFVASDGISKGVSFKRGRWLARISVNRKRTELGYFATQAEALQAYRSAFVALAHQRVRTARVCSDPRDRFFSKVVPNDNGCLIWMGARDKDGYGKFQLNGDGRQKHVRAHRYAFFLAHGHWPSALSLHDCDTPACVNSAHLRDGSQSDNLIDCAVRGRRKSVRLTEHDVRIIRARRAAGDALAAIAARFNVSVPAISSVVHRRTWKHVT